MSVKPDSTKIGTGSLDEKDYHTAMAHFYRGEVGRSMAWRQRLDTTTNWAIISISGVITFSLAHPDVSHMIYMLTNLIVFLLLMIEGRRYRYYDAYRARVRMLEVHFLAPVVLRRSEPLEGGWRELLTEDLMVPAFKIGALESIARRLQRNYIWIFILVLLSWILKIHLHKLSEKPFSVINVLLEMQKDQPLTPYIFWPTVLGFYGVLVGLLVYGFKGRGASGEFEDRLPSGNPWKL